MEENLTLEKADKTEDSKENLKVSKISNGTVIDHIKAGSAFKVLKILGIDENYTDTVSIIINAKSRLLGRKDIVKIENREIDKKEADKISLISGTGTVNLIQNSKIIKKYVVEIPKVIENVLICPNPECITNYEEVETKFYLESKNPITLVCHYCERIVSEMKFK